MCPRSTGAVSEAPQVRYGDALAVGTAPFFQIARCLGLFDFAGDGPGLDNHLWVLTHTGLRQLRRVKNSLDFAHKHLTPF